MNTLNLLKAATLAFATISSAAALDREGESTLLSEEEIQPPAIVYSGVKKVGDGKHAFWTHSFTVVNPNLTASILFTGYLSNLENKPVKEGVISPLYRVQKLSDGKWSGAGGCWCGTGAGTVALLPGSKTTFTAHLRAPGDAESMRVGFGWSLEGDERGQSKTAWSKPVPRKAINEVKK